MQGQLGRIWNTATVGWNISRPTVGFLTLAHCGLIFYTGHSGKITATPTVQTNFESGSLPIVFDDSLVLVSATLKVDEVLVLAYLATALLDKMLAS